VTYFLHSFLPAVSARHDMGQGNVSILQQLQSHRRSGANTKLIYLLDSILFK